MEVRSPGPATYKDQFQTHLKNLSTTQHGTPPKKSYGKEICWRKSSKRNLPLLRATIMMVHNPVFHARTKHIELKYHYIRQQFKLKKVVILSVRSKYELADFLTKPLKSENLRLNRSRIGICRLPLD